MLADADLPLGPSIPVSHSSGRAPLGDEERDFRKGSFENPHERAEQYFDDFNFDETISVRPGSSTPGAIVLIL